jgi:hypothetical protein
MKKIDTKKEEKRTIFEEIVSIFNEENRYRHPRFSRFPDFSGKENFPDFSGKENFPDFQISPERRIFQEILYIFMKKIYTEKENFPDFQISPGRRIFQEILYIFMKKIYTEKENLNFQISPEEEENPEDGIYFPH